jgi:hypothetical protein
MDAAPLAEAVAAYREALALFEKAGAGRYVAGVRANLALAEKLKAELPP